jgi:hypothetical protein
MVADAISKGKLIKKFLYLLRNDRQKVNNLLAVIND